MIISTFQCSTTCGGGVQIRHVKCVNLTSQGPATGCSVELKPNHRQPCNLDPCPESKAGSFKNIFICTLIKRLCFYYVSSFFKFQRNVNEYSNSKYLNIWKVIIRFYNGDNIFDRICLQLALFGDSAISSYIYIK